MNFSRIRAAWRRHGLALVLGLSLLPPVALAQPGASVDRFFANPAFGDARISPTGRHVAMTVSAPGGGRTRLVVIDSRLLTAKVVASLTDADVESFIWVNDERLVFSVHDWQTGQGENYFGPGLFAVSREGGELLTLVQRSQNVVVDHSRGTPRHLSGLPPRTRLHSAARARDSDDVFVTEPRFTLQGDLEALHLYRLNSKTGVATPVQRPGNTIEWVLDATDTPRAVVTRDADRYAVLYNDPATSGWRKLVDFDILRNEGFWPVAFDADGTLYVTSRGGRDKEALYRFDLKTNRLDPEPIVSLADYDLNPSLVVSKRQLVGLRYQSDAPATVWFDAGLQAIQQKVDALLPATVNQVSVPSRPETPQVLVFSFSDTDPGRYLLFDPQTGKLTELGRRMAGIDARQMSPKQMVRYKARDGLGIPAYLTLPGSSSRKNLPLVVLTHGGPWVRGGSWAWSAQSQFLASRGYAVLEPEFRGSTGFGHKHFTAGWKQWGLAMQDDLADGARWAAAQGIADPQRICIAGASYGGYATLMGLIKEPELFRCGVSWVGVTDIDLLYSATWSDMSEAAKLYTMPQLIGDPQRDAEQLKATSPILQAGRLKQPLLLAYGGADRRVPISHGTRFRSAVEKGSSRVEWIEYAEEGHGWALQKNRVDFWTRVEKFLERHIGKP